MSLQGDLQGESLHLAPYYNRKTISCRRFRGGEILTENGSKSRIFRLTKLSLILYNHSCAAGNPSVVEKYSSGRRGPPAKGVGRVIPARGFESLLLRCVVTQTTDYFSHYPAKVAVV